jgi:hypothetical protein
MAQYQNCGSSPAALASSGALATLQGRCTTQRSLVPTTGAGATPGSEGAANTPPVLPDQGLNGQSTSTPSAASGPGRGPRVAGLTLAASALVGLLLI